jgi:SAM-dependent methyltransferase
MDARSNAEDAWRRLGATDPYFAVLTDERFRDADRPGPSRDEFFRSGEADIARLFERIAADHPSFVPRSALDFGCGVGRLLLPLARRVPEVVGVDVSPAMLEEARSNCVNAGLGNVKLMASDSAEYRGCGSFDLIHSLIVFQHIPRRTGMRLVHDLVGRLNPGGVAALHFVYSVRRPLWWRLTHFARKTVPGVHRAANLLSGRRPVRPLMQMNAYPLAQLFALAHDCGAARISSILMDHDGFLGAKLVFRKPS